VKVRRGRRSKQLVGDLKKTRVYLELKEETLDCTVWRTGFGRGYGPDVRQTDMNIYSQIQNHLQLAHAKICEQEFLIIRYFDLRYPRCGTALYRGSTSSVGIATRYGLDG